MKFLMFLILSLCFFSIDAIQKSVIYTVTFDKPEVISEMIIDFNDNGEPSIMWKTTGDEDIDINLPSYRNKAKPLINSDKNSSSVKSIATLLSEMPNSSNNASQTAPIINKCSVFNHMLLFASGIVIGVLGLETLQYIHAQYSTTKIFDLFWINWISENISNDDELLHEKLIEVINQKYADSINRSQLFSMEVDHEIASLEKYLKDNESSFSRKFFSSVEQRLQKAQLAIQHLYYIKALIN